MAQKYKEELVKKDFEEIESDNENGGNQIKLETYQKILKKGGNIHVKFPSLKIKLSKESSFSKLCKLAGIFPEENIVFTLYINEEEMLQNTSSQKQIGSQKSTKDKDAVIYIRSKFKDNTIDKVKKDSMVAYCPNFYHKIWYSIYPLHIVIAMAAFTHNALYYKKYGLTMQSCECMNLCLGILMLFSGIIGLTKVCSKELKNFTGINVILVFSMLFDIGCCIAPNYKEICGETMYNYLQQYKLFAFIGYGISFGIALLTIILNCSITNFYKKYEKEAKENGLLLVEVK